MTEPVIDGDPFGSIKQEKDNPAPAAKDVNFLHTRSDLDTSQNAQHHTIGIGHNQAAVGDHNHNGRSSRLIGAGEGWTTKSLSPATDTARINELYKLLHLAIDFKES